MHEYIYAAFTFWIGVGILRSGNPWIRNRRQSLSDFHTHGRGLAVSLSPNTTRRRHHHLPLLVSCSHLRRPPLKHQPPITNYSSRHDRQPPLVTHWTLTVQASTTVNRRSSTVSSSPATARQSSPHSSRQLLQPLSVAAVAAVEAAAPSAFSFRSHLLHQIILDSLWDPISVSVLIPRVVKVHSLALSSALPRNHSRPFQLMHPPMPVRQRVVVLVIGGGGREHALCYALKRSHSCDAVFCAPGNAGISNSGDATCIADLDVLDGDAVISFCRKWSVGLVVVGPEAPLVSGLANKLVKAGIPTFGPSSEAAALEGSKNFMKNLCDKYGIPTAKYKTFTDPNAAKQYIQEEGAPIVVKADGLAAGKGVIVAMTLEEAYEAVDSMLLKNAFGSAGCRVIIEEFLEGEEASFFALVDGENAIPLESAQDHKRVGDGDTGPNTGGMGAYSPAPVLTKELQSVVMESIILPTVKGMSAEGCKFVGVLYAGLMIEKKSGLPKLIEYNVRFGDPECQVLMVRLESDLAEVLLAACRGELTGVTLNWSPGSAMVVVMASKGYPGSYEKGSEIQNLEEAEQVAPSVKIFHAGTALDADGNFIATGGRVLGVTAKGKDVEEAQDRAYLAVEEINWPGGFYRRDIGWRALPQKQFATRE
ncbi:phosphoribosylamine--glycine ligase [Citrus sinensis]|uniref:Phosphoribosylamine--glycine ligase n=1 Tax=Citrus sinensis TaxID=2711 RepID=A0ACB8K903_CITSI|nr:phosphoribosylamine--glycine ligase [Citrus sinensis]